ncbi:hypothetical protein GF396_03240 [Candidatus Pacearchaeota archaeon]|nr:hypothetical protein [Candidatus Pacearchaeota archaeon]
MENTIERRLIRLIATDRIHKPISSMSGKLKRRQPSIAKTVSFSGGFYDGDRTWARIDSSDKNKARGMKEGIARFSENFPKYGEILQGYIQEERTVREKYLVFGMQEGSRVTADDYVSVMTDLGLSEGMARNLYPELMDLSRNLSRKRNESERSILLEQVI